MKEIYLESIHSTNTYAKEHCSSFCKEEITCIVADEQTAGRGRYQRPWISPKGVNIYATFYFTLPIKTPQWTSLSQLMALSLAQVLEQEGLSPKLKWPNDLQFNEKKFSGILTEVQMEEEYIEIFLGVGINVNLDLETARKIDQPATSLLIETGRMWNRRALLESLKEQFSEDLFRFQREGFAPFHAAFEERLSLRGKTIRVFDGQREWVGICHGIDPEGQLELLLPDQSIHTIYSGEIIRG